MNFSDYFAKYLNDYLKDGAIIGGDAIGLYDEEHKAKLKELVEKDTRYLYKIQEEVGIDPFEDNYYGPDNDIKGITLDYFLIPENLVKDLPVLKQKVFAAIDKVYNEQDPSLENPYKELDDLTEDTKQNSSLSAEDLAKLDKYFKDNSFVYENEGVVDDGQDGHYFYTDELSYNLEYDNDKYSLEISIYHSSEDNNAENEDYYTDYYEEEYNTIEDLYNDYPLVVEDVYKNIKDNLDDDKLDEGIIFSDKATRCQIKDLLNTENQFILNRLQAGRIITDSGANVPYRLSPEELEKLKDEYIYYEDNGDAYYARFEKPVNAIRKLLGLPEQDENPLDSFFK